ncbi:AGAP002098-PA-like protein [Anopheles sinensis]|uniref:AGAP002098-PA-like protein n=1 Tax=Anopheles sinensis TaxID=74873 RepID=A0A084V9X0_ANOSI|nr:AGAP002098-PA-like protein [Anopheles sinensis]
MSDTAARLQNHNQEMVKCLNVLRNTRTVLEKRLAAQEQQREGIRKEIENLQRSLTKLEGSIADDTKKLNDCVKCISETESGYNKVVDTLQLLLMSAKEKSGVPNE